MKLLLDTHVLLWAATDPDRLQAEVRAALADRSHDVLASIVSAWEIAIKQSLEQLELAKPAEEWLPDVLRRSGSEVRSWVLPIRSIDDWSPKRSRTATRS